MTTTIPILVVVFIAVVVGVRTMKTNGTSRRQVRDCHVAQHRQCPKVREWSLEALYLR